MKLKFVAALLAGSAVGLSSPAFAQNAIQTEAAEPTQPDQSDAAADAAIASATPVDEAQAKIELLQQQVEALQASIEEIKTQQAKVTPSWKGAPQWEDKDAGFTFKPRGALQFDAGFVGYPNGQELRGTVGGLNFANLGWNSRARRLLFGADGTLPGGFKYSVEFNLAQAQLDYEDVWLGYDFKNSPLSVQFGYFYPFSSLETMTSSKNTSFLERASITDAFNYSRRVGIGLFANDKTADHWTFQAGIFNQPMADQSFTRTGWQASARGVFSPTIGKGRLHLGANFQHRTNTREAMGAQYRTRPLTQITDQRLIDTGTLAARGDDVAGIELGAIFKGLHVAAEAQKVWVRDAFNATQIADLTANAESNRTPVGTALNGNPSFTGGYFELGYFFTGETRGYKTGRWDRTKVLKPVSDGGLGAVQLNGRIDYVELRDRVGGDSSSIAAPFYVNGGRQIGYQASLIWTPMDYVRFMAQFGHVSVTGGPRAVSVIFDDATLPPQNRRNFKVDTAAVRAQVEF